jgi:hypothetical protein
VRASRWIMPAIVIVVLLGGVQVARGLGYWQTSGQELVDLSNLTAADIKGWMSLEEVAGGTTIPLPKLLEILGLPAETLGTTAFKDLEGTVDVTTAREKIGAYLGETAPGGGGAPASPTSTPAPAATEAAGTLPAATPKSEATRTPAPAGQLDPSAIKGTMTLKEVSEGTGIPLDKLLAEAKLPADIAPTTTVKELVGSVPGFEVQALRDAAAKLLGK